MAAIEPTAINSNGTRYTTSDHLGSPHVVTNSAASVISRHDYMPFGTELGAGVGGRTTGIGYDVADGLRQKFTQQERDSETGLDYFGARYYESTQGRFTSIDPWLPSALISDPQTEVIETYAEIDVMIMTLPLSLAGGATRLGLNAAGSGTKAAGAGGFDLALGLAKHVQQLADETGSLTYNQLARSGVFSPEKFAALANEAKTIRFTTQGVDWARWGHWARTPGSWSPYLQHVTNWEMHQVLTNPRWLAKTVWY